MPPPPFRRIAGTISQHHCLFHLVYRMAKRGSPPTHGLRDAETLQLASSTVTLSYNYKGSVVAVTYAIAAPICSVEAKAMESPTFFALAFDSSSDRTANEQGLVCTQTLRSREVWTAFLGLRGLRDSGAASTPGT